MTAAYTVPVTRCDQSTLDICTIYLVGGFDEEKIFYSGLPEFRKPSEYMSACGFLADLGCENYLMFFAAVVKYRLARGSMTYRGRN